MYIVYFWINNLRKSLFGHQITLHQNIYKLSRICWLLIFAKPNYSNNLQAIVYKSLQNADFT